MMRRYSLVFSNAYKDLALGLKPHLVVHSGK